MPMYIEIKINDRPIYDIRVSNEGGNINGECRYRVETKDTNIPLEYDLLMYDLIHDRRDGALTLAIKAINELDLYEKRDD
jgi:hypothetical protein